MRTLVAYDFDVETDAPLRLPEGVQRVERWYGQRWPEGWRRRDRRHGRRGLLVWDLPEGASLWPSWRADASQAVATMHVPLGFEQVVGQVPFVRAPLLLARHLVRNPESILKLAAPFSVANLDDETLTVMVDAFGIARIFEVRGPRGWAWSNRPLAACLFAGAPVRPSEAGWRYHAACDWNMGETTPYEGVRIFGPGERVTADDAGRRGSQVDWLSGYADAALDPLAPDTVDRTASSLVATARSVATLWPDSRPILHLSGGRDSRLTAAAFIAAGVDVRLKTDGQIHGEADTARALVAAAPRSLDHEVFLPQRAVTAPDHLDASVGRVLRWHDRCEGLRSSVHMHAEPPPFAERRLPLISGSAGEIAHGVYYPPDVTAIESRGLDRRLDTWTATIMAKLVLPRGVADPARQAVRDRVREALGEAVERGLTNAVALDYVYVVERMRRWGAIAERSNKILPLLTSDFVRSAFALTPQQRREKALHRALVGRLVPGWETIPFFRATLVERTSAPRPSLWQYADADVVTSVLDEIRSADWGADYDARVVRQVWESALWRGNVGLRSEILVQRVLWRALFDDHCAAVRGEAVPTRLPAARVRGGATVDVLRVPRALALRANDVPTLRRLARTPVGYRLRRTIGV